MGACVRERKRDERKKGGGGGEAEMGKNANANNNIKYFAHRHAAAVPALHLHCDFDEHGCVRTDEWHMRCRRVLQFRWLTLLFRNICIWFLRHFYS